MSDHQPSYLRAERESHFYRTAIGVEVPIQAPHLTRAWQTY